MEIKINVPDEAIQRIAEGLKRDIRTDIHAKTKGKGDVKFQLEGIELITALLQNKIDDVLLRTDPVYMAKKKALKEESEKADKEAKERIEALKKK